MNVPFKRGSMLRLNDRYYYVEDIVEHHSGKQKPTIHVSLRDAYDGRHIERTLDLLQDAEEVIGKFRTMQYLYSKGKHWVFMDSETFDEIELDESQLKGRECFLREGEQFRVQFVGEQPLALEMPDIIQIHVADTAAATHAVGVSSSVTKEARLENGLEVRVPLFIKSGDLIQLDTRTKAYVGKAKEK